MKDVEIVVFNDKSWVRLTEYQKIKEENEKLKENIKNARKKLFDILTDYEIGNYDNNIHQFYKDVYNIHNELMDLEKGE